MRRTAPLTEARDNSQGRAAGKSSPAPGSGPFGPQGEEMTFHIGAKPGDIAETVLLPGDPYRARWAAQKFLENPVLVN